MRDFPRVAVVAILACTLVPPMSARQHATTPSTTASSTATAPNPATTPAPRAGAPTISPASSAPAGRSADLSRTKEYRLGAGDKLRIEVYKDTQLSGAVQIRPDGKITMPLVGDIEARGKTPIQLRDDITAALKDYVNNPAVTVVVVEATPETAYVIGEVNRPGPIALNGELTVIQALSMAGGLTDWAKTKSIRILRQGPAGMQTVTFDYRSALEGLGAPVYVLPNDTIVVPESGFGLH